MWSIHLIYLLKLIALAIEIIRGLAKVGAIAFDAFLLAVFIACHPREMMRTVSAQSAGVQIIIYFWLSVIAHEAVSYLVSLK